MMDNENEIQSHPTEEGYLREYQSRSRRFTSEPQIQQIPRAEMIEDGRRYVSQYPVYIDEASTMVEELLRQLIEPTRQTPSNINQGDHMNDAVTYAAAMEAQPFNPVPIEPVATLQDLTKTLADFASYPTPVILLAELLEQKHLTPKSNETDTNFLNEQQQCLEVIMQLTEAIGHQNFMINQFIQPVSKSKSRRLVSSTGAIGAIINAYIHEQEKIKVLEKLEQAKSNSAAVIDSILKSKRIKIPKINPLSNLSFQIEDVEGRLTRNTSKLEQAQEKVSILTVENNNYAKELRDMRAYLKSIGQDDSANQMDEVFKFLESLDGRSFPYTYVGVLPTREDESDTNIYFLFKRNEQTILDKDSELEWIVPEMFVKMRLYKETSGWKYSFSAKSNKFYTMADVFKVGDSAYIRWNSSLFHPHVNTTDSICRGNAASMLDNMCTDLTKIEDSLLVLDSLFRTYNPGSPYQSTVNFLKYGPQFLVNLSRLTNVNQGTFTGELKNKVATGEMSLTELSDALLDKFHDVMRHRFMCHLADYGLSWEFEDHSAGYPQIGNIQDYHGGNSEYYSWKSELSTYRPFDSSSRCRQFMDNFHYFLSVGDFCQKFDDFYVRFYVPKVNGGYTVVKPVIIEALSVFMEDTKQSYRTMVENRIKNYENVLTKGYEIDFIPSEYRVNNQNFDVWFTQTRKK